MLGHVCQLNYAGGGRLVCQKSSGERAFIPFLKAQGYLRIGQEVVFSINDGAEAVDIRPVDDLPIETTTVKLSKVRQLQRKMQRFHNATLEQQLDLVGRAEDKLRVLLEDQLGGQSVEPGFT